MKLWIDVEDLFHYAQRVRRPSGIQRLAFEVQRALADLSPDCVRFIRHSKYGTGFCAVPFSQVEALFANLSRPRGRKSASRRRRRWYHRPHAPEDCGANCLPLWRQRSASQRSGCGSSSWKACMPVSIFAPRWRATWRRAGQCRR